MHRTIVLGIVSSLLLIACSGNSTIEESAIPQDNPTSAVIFKVTQSGGCIMIGQNCAEHTLRNDGSVEVKRIGIDLMANEVEARGDIDQGQVDSWLDLVANTDFDSLISRLPPGTCSGCLDGIDYIYTIYLQDGDVAINSLDHQFSEAEPFFAMTAGVYDAMLNAAILEIQQRSN